MRSTELFQRVGAVALAASVFLLPAVAVYRYLSDTDLVSVAATLALPVLGMNGVRLRVTGRPPGWGMVVVLTIGIAAEIAGTSFPLPGTVLGAPVIVGLLVVLWRSDWRLGDLAIAMLLLGAGAAVAYSIEASIHPGTGSYGDQAAGGLAALGILLSLVALVVERRLPAGARRLVAAGGLSTVGAVAGAAANYAVLAPLGAVAAVALTWGTGWIALDVWRSAQSAP